MTEHQWEEKEKGEEILFIFFMCQSYGLFGHDEGVIERHINLTSILTSFPGMQAPRVTQDQ